MYVCADIRFRRQFQEHRSTYFDFSIPIDGKKCSLVFQKMRIYFLRKGNIRYEWFKSHFTFGKADMEVSQIKLNKDVSDVCLKDDAMLH